MIKFLAVRYVAFALFILFCSLTGSFAALNLGFMTSGVIPAKPLVEAMDIYLVAIPILNVVFIVPVIGIELYRKGAIASRIWFELLWVAVFFLAYLGVSIPSTLGIPNSVCNTGGPMKFACMTSLVVIAFTWMTSSAYFIYFFTLLTYCIIHSKPGYNIWNTTVVDHPWTPKPSVVHLTHTDSIDSRRTLADTRIHAYSLKAATQDDLEKDGDSVVLPVHTQDATLGGPPTFGPPGRRAIDLGTAGSRAMGVNAVNGVPAYDAQQEDRRFNDQGLHKFHQNPRRDQGRVMDRNAYTSTDPPRGTREAPWQQTNGEESPSPATIVHATRVSQPSVSLYPAHVVATGLTTQPAKSAKPGKQTTALNELIRAAGLRQSVTSLPYLKSPSGRTQDSDAASVGSEEIKRSRSQSIDTFVQAKPAAMSPAVGHKRGTSEVPGIKRVKSSRPRRRPPPLDLSALSNIASANR